MISPELDAPNAPNVSVIAALVVAFGFMFEGYREVEEADETGTWQEVAIYDDRTKLRYYFYLSTESYEWPPFVSQEQLLTQDDIEDQAYNSIYPLEENTFPGPLAEFLYALREGKINA